MFASDPVAPDLQRDPDAYELVLADVLINNGATEITQGNITDLRLDKSLCGIVHNTVDQVDTTTIFNQYQDFFNGWSEDKRNEFKDWFETVKGILNDDTAGNLLTLINENKTSIQNAIKIIPNVSILSTEWTDGDDHFEYHVNDLDIDGSCVIDVAIHKESLSAGAYLLPVTESYAGGFILCSSKAPSEDIVIDYRITREAE